jgi:hypothetical protein
MEGKMKKIKVLVLVVLFLGMAVGNLFAQYLDVGDDPELIKIISTTEISIPKGYEFKQWSPDGEFFTISNESYQDKELKTYIFNKSGQLYKQCGGYFTLWSSDSKKIVLIDSNKSKGVLIYDIVSFSTFKTSIQIKHVYNIHQFIDDKIIHSKYDEIYEYDIKLNSSSLIFKSTTKGMVSDIYIYDNYLFFTQVLSNHEKPLFSYNMNDQKVLKKLEGYLVPIKYYLIKNKKLVFSYLDSFINFLNVNGSILFKFSERLNGEQDIRRNMGFDIMYSSLAPNGKLYAISYRHFSEYENIINSSDIYLVSLVSGKKYNLTNTSEKTELVKGWSPQGNRIVYLEFKSNKLIIAEIGK